LLAVAISNEDGAFAKQYDLGRPDDAVALSLFKDVSHWTFWVDDANSIALHAAADCRSGEVSKAISGVIDSLLKSARAGMEQPDPAALAVGAHEREYRMIKALLANIRVEHTERSFELLTDGFGTLAEVGSFIPHAGTGEPFVGWVQPTVNGVRPVGCTHPTMTPSLPREV